MNADTTATCQARNARKYVPEKKDRASQTAQTTLYTSSRGLTSPTSPTNDHLSHQPRQSRQCLFRSMSMSNSIITQAKGVNLNLNLR
jgi:hypothetical protein